MNSISNSLVTPLATESQCRQETLALKIIDFPAVRRARELARCILLEDAAVKNLSGRAGMERALDQWLLALVLREVNGDPYRPEVLWSVDNTPRAWFSHIFPGAAVAVDNPDNVNREMPIDGELSYEVSGQYSANKTANFSLKLEVEPDDHAGIGEHVFMLTSREIVSDSDGRFTINISPNAPPQSINHMQSQAGRLTLYARDSFSDWRQQATKLSIRLISKDLTLPPSRSAAQIAAKVAECLPAFVRFWSGFKNEFLGYPDENTLVGPIGRENSARWGFLAGGRFLLQDDEALLITIRDGGAAYTGLQVTDPWTVCPDPLYHQSSLNSDQLIHNSDGFISFVVSLADCGYANWIDTVGLHEGWFLLRWQGLPLDARSDELVQGCRLVKLSDLPSLIPSAATVDLPTRQRQLAQRSVQYRQRSACHDF